MQIVLASASPRRRELLKLLGLDFITVASHMREYPPENVSTDELVMTLAKQKASAVAISYPHDCVIGADTVVELEGEVFGKPHTPERAKDFLSRMQGKKHFVYTGVAVRMGEYEDVRYCSTTVLFAPMSEQEIDWYVSTGEPLDKAGAYGAQEKGALFIERIDGDYTTVVGLPLCKLGVWLREYM